MIIEKGTPGNTFSTLPTRHFMFILDPECIFFLQQKPYKNVIHLIQDLKALSPSVVISFLFPNYLADSAAISLATVFKSIVFQIPNAKAVPAFNPDVALKKEIGELLIGEPSQKARALLALSDEVQADGLITNNEILIQARYALAQYHRIRIVPLDEFADVTEVCAHGHSIFWSATSFERRWPVDTFYPAFHWKAARYYKWWNATQAKLTNDAARGNLRSALANRYVFLLYSRDMIRFYELQREHFSRRGLMQRFWMPLGYHVTNFYSLLWGMLDQLTVIAKHIKNLSILEKKCAIRSKDFWKEFGPIDPGLKTFIKSKLIEEWIKKMADMRHSASHQTIPIPTTIVVDTEDSKKSDDEILQIIKTEYSVIYSLLPQEHIKVWETEMIMGWKIRHMKTIAPSVVKIIGEDGTIYLWDPVSNVDYDLERLNAIMDAFLVSLFR